MSLERLSTKPVRQIPRIDYAASFLRSLLFGVILVAVISAPSLMNGGWDHPARWGSIHPPHLSLIGAASLPIKLHLVTLFGVAVAGAVLLFGVKGTGWHKALGWVFSTCMFATGVVTLFIPSPVRGPHLGPFGMLHIFSLTALIGVPLAIYWAKSGRLMRHGRLMCGLFFGAIFIAGLGAFTPGRLIWRVFFG